MSKGRGRGRMVSGRARLQREQWRSMNETGRHSPLHNDVGLTDCALLENIAPRICVVV